MNKLVQEFIDELKQRYEDIKYEDEIIFWNTKRIMKISTKNDSLIAVSLDGSGRETFVKTKADLIKEFDYGYSLAAGNVCSI